MTLEAQNRSIAEVCKAQKWRQRIISHEDDIDYFFADSMEALQAKIDAHVKSGMILWRLDGEPSWYPSNDYTGSLDAMSKALPHLTDSQKRLFGELLADRVGGIHLYVKHALGGENVFAIASATAPIIAECFLRAVGRWQEKGEK